MASTPMTERVSDLIGETLMIDVPSAETDLIDAGLIDSLALVSLITEIETEFGVQLPLDEFEIDDFRSAAQIAQYVAKYMPEGAAG